MWTYFKNLFMFICYVDFFSVGITRSWKPSHVSGTRTWPNKGIQWKWWYWYCILLLRYYNYFRIFHKYVRVQYISLFAFLYCPDNTLIRKAFKLANILTYFLSNEISVSTPAPWKIARLSPSTKAAVTLPNSKIFWIWKGDLRTSWASWLVQSSGLTTYDESLTTLIKDLFR